MGWDKLQDNRMAVVAYLISGSPAKTLGRTAVMKFCYFLQAIRRVPLGYRFSMYSYGPFASDVLSDLGTAVNLRGASSQIEYNSVGYGYRLAPGERAEHLVLAGGEFIEQNRESLDWVLAEFGDHSSSDLELESTIIFLDCEAAKKQQALTLPALSKRVREVKPHFSESYVLGKAQELQRKGLLKAVAEADVRTAVS